MTETQLPGVEHLTGEITGAFAAVKFIAEDGMTEMMQVHADLVGAAAVQSALDQAHVAARTQDPIPGFCGASLTARDAHPLPVNRMARNCFVDDAGSFARGAGNESEINFSHRARRKLFGEIAVSRIVFCDDESAAGFLVEPVHNAGTFFSADAGKIFAVGEECVHQGVLLMSRAGMHHPTGWFVQDEEIVVLKKNLERHRLRLGFNLCDLRFAQFDDLPRAHGIARAGRVSIHPNESVANKRLKSRPGKGRERPGEKAIEPLVGVFVCDFELDHG